MIAARAFIVLLAAAGAVPPQIAVTCAADTADRIVFQGKLKHPRSFDPAALRKLPAEQVQVSFRSERGETTATYTGVRLWALLTAAGGIDDDTKGAELRHIIRVTGRDGYVVILSTGEIAPDFGGKPALIAYQRDDEPRDAAVPRLVMPGDKRGGRDVRDVVTIQVE